MDAVAEQRVLLGVDVIGSARTPGEDLHRLSQAWRTILRNALVSAGITLVDILEWEQQGDGALLTLPHGSLGMAVDMSQRLDDLAVNHNRHSRPEVRFRMVVSTGPVPEEPTYSRAKVDRARLLDAPAFRELIARCHRESAAGAHTGLIMADHAFQTAFGGDHTELVRRAEFARIPVATKEFRATAWVRVPGFDARTLATFVADAGTGEREAGHAPRHATVHNEVHGPMSGVQAGTIHGGVRFGRAGE